MFAQEMIHTRAQNSSFWSLGRSWNLFFPLEDLFFFVISNFLIIFANMLCSILMVIVWKKVNFGSDYSNLEHLPQHPTAS